MSQYVLHIVALPPARTVFEEQAYNYFNNVVLNCTASLHSSITEAAVSMGRYANLTGTNY